MHIYKHSADPQQFKRWRLAIHETGPSVWNFVAGAEVVEAVAASISGAA